MPNFPVQAGRFVASAYGAWQARIVSVPNSTHLVVSPTESTTPTGDVFPAWHTNAPLFISVGSTHQEIATPSAIDYSTPGVVMLTFASPLSFTHSPTDTIQSGTFGLQEAINNAPSKSVVLCDTTFGGSVSTITGVQGSADVLIEYTAATGGLTYYSWTGSAYALVTPASGLELQTDYQPNVDQNLLNLVSGTGMSLNDDGAGNITINGPSVAPPFPTTVAHGSAQVFNQPSNSGTIYLTPSGKGIYRVSLTLLTQVPADTSFTLGLPTVTYREGAFLRNDSITPATIDGPALNHNTAGDTYTKTLTIFVGGDGFNPITYSWPGSSVDAGANLVTTVSFVCESLVPLF